MNFGEDLALQIMLTNKSYHQYLFRALKDIEVYHHYQVLLVINKAGGRIEQKNICETLQIEKSNMVAVIAVLQKKGYVTKDVNFKDRRGKLISLTDKARDLIILLNKLFNSFEEHLADEVTWQEMYSCLRVLNKISTMLNNVSITDAAVVNIETHEVLRQNLSA
ncbi:MarR family winged helix-turn-helix transcriptional regulator [Mucilaginibacter glaciei]|uniref:Winged helix DNA-binding protein n=1 Tax=Mucilaginibacter glaciei TaxID=2772109 RepID=A0A926NNY0_9SPHI|nr:winged helix DNA-binding protein [Mucilaginibacter glaciei]MBD1392372.1 winged helix DNA-binding protein [Mucilaginibacter glaciei]